MTPETPAPLAYPPLPPPKTHQDHISKGVMYGCAAMFLLAIMNVFAKTLSVNHSVLEVTFYRNFIAIIPLTIYIVMTKRYDVFQTKQPMTLFFRVLVGTIGLVLTFQAFALLPMADATVVIMTSVLIVPALAYFILGEHMGPHRWTAIVIGLIGVIIMMRPSGHIETIGIAVAFAAAIFQSGIQIFLRKLKTESSFTIVYYFMLGGTVLTGLCMPFVAVTPSAHEFLLLIGVGISGGLAQYCLTSAFRLAPAGVISPLNYTGLIWATMFDIIFWHNMPGLGVILGAAIIITSQAYILHRERHHAQKNAKNKK